MKVFLLFNFQIWWKSHSEVVANFPKSYKLRTAGPGLQQGALSATSCGIAQLCPTLWDPMEFSRPEYWSRQPFLSPGDLPNPGIERRSPILQADSLPAEPQGKPNNTGVGSLSLFQWIFLTQDLNQSLLHCRWILYQLCYQGIELATQFVWVFP